MNAKVYYIGILLFVATGAIQAEETRKVQFLLKYPHDGSLTIDDAYGNSRELPLKPWEQSYQGSVVELQRRAYKRPWKTIEYVKNLHLKGKDWAATFNEETINELNNAIENNKPIKGEGIATFEISGPPLNFITYVGYKPLQRRTVGTSTNPEKTSLPSISSGNRN